MCILVRQALDPLPAQLSHGAVDGAWGGMRVRARPRGEVAGAVAQARDLVAIQEIHDQQPPPDQARHAAWHRQRAPQPLRAAHTPPQARASARSAMVPARA